MMTVMRKMMTLCSWALIEMINLNSKMRDRNQMLSKTWTTWSSHWTQNATAVNGKIWSWLITQTWLMKSRMSCFLNTCKWSKRTLKYFPQKESWSHMSKVNKNNNIFMFRDWWLWHWLLRGIGAENSGKEASNVQHASSETIGFQKISLWWGGNA